MAMPTLKEIRLDKLISQEDLAKKSGVSSVTINRLERGHQKPNFKTIHKLADALGVDPHEIEF
jgi:transcriptional regulator with XRE-family HTH domain